MEDLNNVDGPRMIRELQAFVGIDESVEDSEIGWESMSEENRQGTCSAYRFFISKDFPVKE